jgi:dolichyl-phosphate-mannose-protein mannosyltransferase
MTTAPPLAPPFDPDTPVAPGPGRAWRWDLLAMVLATLDLSIHLTRNWVAFDEGAMALAASLVRDGKWPHTDFSDVYSGGLALLDAAAFQLFGDDLLAMRIPFGVASIVWVGILAACFRRFVPAPAAAGLALVGFLWGPPLYTAAMPSWYLLFFATALCWALLRWNETEDPRWWGMAGLCIGLALFFKINALFLLAGAGCVLLTDERMRGGPVAALVVLLGVAGACVTVSNGWPWEHAATLTLPLVALAVVTVHHASRAGAGAPSGLGHALAPGAWLAAGVALVVVPWVLAYAIHGGLGELAQGLFVLPFRRPHSARLLALPFELADLLPIAILPVLLFVRWRREWAIGVAVAVIAVAFFVTDLVTIAPTPVVRGLWRTMRGWAVLAPLMVAVIRYRELGPSIRATMIAGWIAAWFALIQYPFAGANYLAYVAPLLLLAGVAAVHGHVSRPVGAAVIGALVVVTLGIGHGQSLNELGYTYRTPQPPLSRLEGAHGGGLLIPTPHVELMTDVVEVLDRWGARTLVAGPDAPHLYYLSGRPIPDREFFEFLAPEWSPAEFERRIAAHDPDAVVLNAWAPFSGIPLDSVAAHLKTRAIADTTLGPYRMLLLHRPATAP